MKKKYFLAILVSLIIIILCAPLSNASTIIVTDNQNTYNQTTKVVPEWLQNPVFTGLSAITDKADGTIELSVSNEKVIFGETGKLSDPFVQKVTFEKWAGENWLSFKLDATNFESTKEAPVSATILSVENSVISSSKDYSIEYKPTGIVEGFNELGGLDIIITLNSKPLNNFLTFSYDSNGVIPYLQPELTAEEIKEGSVRPDYVVNSVAFYADGKANYTLGKVNYGTGKVGHLYRMTVVDSKGNKSWFDWSIGKGSQLIGTIDQKFIDNAVYPITIQPVGDTFGYTTAGSSYSWLDESPGANWYGSIFTASGSGTVESLTISRASGTSSTRATKGIIVSHDDLTIIENGIGNAVGTISIHQNKQWVVSTFSVSPTINSGTVYILSAIAPYVTYVGKIYYDSGDSNQGHREYDNNYTTPTNPSSITHSTNKYSIYCTYTPAASGWTHISYYDGVSQSVIGYIMGVIKASIGKLNGVTP
jgi:hypothetical protein